MPRPLTLALLALTLAACGDKTGDDTGAADDTDAADDTGGTGQPTGDCAGMSGVFASEDAVLYSDGTDYEASYGLGRLERSPDGCLWMVSLGVQRFDGTGFTLYDTTNSPMVTTSVRSIRFHEGEVWTAHESGQLDSFDGATGTGTNHGDVAYDVARFDSSGVLWSTPDYASNVIRAYETDGSLTTYTPSDLGAGDVMLIDASPDGQTMWFSSYSGETSHLMELDTSSRTATFHAWPNTWVSGATGAVDADGTLWALTGKGMWSFDGAFTEITANDQMSYAQATRDTDGSVVWVGANILSATATETSLYKVQGNELVADRVMHGGDIYAQPTGFAVDAEGNYWMTTQGGDLVGSKR